MEYGDKDGHGRYGILDGDDERIICHECGKSYKSVASHVVLSHDMTAEDYKREHGIPRGQALMAPSLIRVRKERGRERVQGPGWENFEAARNPIAASHARTKDTFVRRGADKTAQIENGKKRIAGQKKPVTRRCQKCNRLLEGVKKGRKFCSDLCAKVGGYESRSDGRGKAWYDAKRSGVSTVDLAAKYGVSVHNVNAVVRTYVRYLQDAELLRLRDK